MTRTLRWNPSWQVLCLMIRMPCAAITGKDMSAVDMPTEKDITGDAADMGITEKDIMADAAAAAVTETGGKVSAAGVEGTKRQTKSGSAAFAADPDSQLSADYFKSSCIESAMEVNIR